ncbi:hypothetical protein BDN70DRAFT_477640 [Pholiota conissans]|uniref:Uncharacterized protein n=1 Tax=Pholiota conissans TaxID=109636 RepID=A0A9P5YPT1_9AGAR|nr:hypothetical protein BDN70DRAFT_477640 [Pholiota conissans]
MARTHRPLTACTSHQTSAQKRAEKRKKAALCMLGAISGVATVVSHIAPFFVKQPMHTSILTGQAWVEELLRGMDYCSLVYLYN